MITLTSSLLKFRGLQSSQKQSVALVYLYRLFYKFLSRHFTDPLTPETAAVARIDSPLPQLIISEGPEAYIIHAYALVMLCYPEDLKLSEPEGSKVSSGLWSQREIQPQHENVCRVCLRYTEMWKRPEWSNARQEPKNKTVSTQCTFHILCQMKLALYWSQKFDC